ncbi:hypothetical protein AJ78_09077 [Emergomyces pasteurianus Ep9510]|uniref:Uncharacterized protein n=1 Tax=Emergomyces pasteurianus Ep9510 TaxID=1447872 RepID=A0A1J9NXI5_9EURO|nr:hypothetical protein AJ78_09077 [Emergomyces pasteurianus Ep9510]
MTAVSVQNKKNRSVDPVPLKDLQTTLLASSDS